MKITNLFKIAACILIMIAFLGIYGGTGYVVYYTYLKGDYQFTAIFGIIFLIFTAGMLCVISEIIE